MNGSIGHADTKSQGGINGHGFSISANCAGVVGGDGAGGLRQPARSARRRPGVVLLDPTASAADRALSALSRGDTANAENFALSALRKNPKDPYALLVAGMTYQATARYDLARKYYEVILTNPTTAMMTVSGENGTVQRTPVMDIARANTAVIDKITGRSEPRSIFNSGRAPGQEAAPPPVSDAETNVAGRFRILKRLLDEGLITPDEFSARRAANVGALLPLSAPVPAPSLERPIPHDNQIVDRLRALKAAVEAREMAPADQGAERAVILDGLLPAQPRARAMPPLPPKDMLDAAQAVGRLERLRAAGLITADEAGKERAALDHALQAQLAGRPVDGTATGLRYGRIPAAAPQSPVSAQPLPAAGSAWGVSLALSKSESGAKVAWEKIKAKFPMELGDKQFVAHRIELRGKGVRWRVIAGPLDGKEAARKLCVALKLHRQSCDPALFGG